MNILYVVKSLSIVEPLGPMQMSAITRNMGHKSHLAVLDEGDLLEKIEKNDIDLVAMSFLSPEAGAFKKASHRIKSRRPDMTVIAGGPHPTFFPEIVDSWPLDAVVLGEGDRVMGKIVSHLEAGKDISDIPNLHTRRKKNALLPLVADLDTLPYPDRDLVHGRVPLNMVPMKSFMATRGCPYNCAYCFNNAYKKLYRHGGRMRRQRSVEHLIREIETVKQRYSLRFVRFGDDVFVTGHDQWLEEFVEQYRRRIGLPFYFLIYPHLVNREVISALKSAGCHSVGISIETGNEEIRKKIIKRPISDEVIKNAYAILRDHDIRLFSNCMLGLPESTIADDIQSLELTFACAPTYASFTVFAPFPGTELYDYCKSRGYVTTTFDDDAYPGSTFQKSCLNLFSDREKEIQTNIMLLGALANRAPFLRKRIVGRLIYFKTNFLFKLVGFGVRNYLQRKIWPFRLRMRTFFRLVWKVYQIDRKNYADKS